MAEITTAVNMSFRVDKELKQDADNLFKKLGMNTSVALNMFLTQCVREQSLPFVPSMNVPNNRLIKALEEAENIQSGKTKAKHYEDFDEALKDID